MTNTKAAALSIVVAVRGSCFRALSGFYPDHDKYSRASDACSTEEMIVILIALVIVYVLLAVCLNLVFNLPIFLKHWYWWLSLFCLLVPAYLMQVRDQLSVQSKNLRWATRGLERFVFGPTLGFVYRHMILISLICLITVFLWLGWKGAVLMFLVSIGVATCLLPLSKKHAQQILIECENHAELQNFLQTGKFQ